MAKDAGIEVDDIVGGADAALGAGGLTAEERERNDEVLLEMHPKSYGWNDKIKWVKLNQAGKIAKAKLKPVMVVISQDGCSACKTVRDFWSSSLEIELLSKKFVMVLTRNDEEPSEKMWGKKFQPDGRYFPRMFFLTHRAKVLPITTGKEKYQHYFSNAIAIADAMQRAEDAYLEHSDYLEACKELGVDPEIGIEDEEEDAEAVSTASSQTDSQHSKEEL
uniref:Thioredoxin-like fold domain-containing protein n=1 Tax=Oxyrrhis marina TaxID=2969 RepID=A0A7S3UHV4_OXYMA|mmetsp:Transcript_1353/g.2087  ORF Transcript_1353/g.2087 Transcript_1353/m.2087 type:complete len:220 (-) Transcript_1353:64-723(-)